MPATAAITMLAPINASSRTMSGGIPMSSRAISARNSGAHNVGPISPFALHALREMVIAPRGADRFPRQCTVDDLLAQEVRTGGDD
jgi:hypothetical protein